MNLTDWQTKILASFPEAEFEEAGPFVTATLDEGCGDVSVLGEFDFGGEGTIWTGVRFDSFVCE